MQVHPVGGWTVGGWRRQQRRQRGGALIWPQSRRSGFKRFKEQLRTASEAATLPHRALPTTMLALQPLAGWCCAGSRSVTPQSSQLEARRLAHRRHAASAAANVAGRRGATPAASSPSAAFQKVLDETDEEIVGWHWTGSDEFSVLDDRRDAPPRPLPPLYRST